MKSPLRSIITLALGCALTSMLTVHAQAEEGSSVAVPNDFDGDGITDLVTLSTTANGWGWKSTPTSDPKTARILDTTFGLTTDIPVPGYWVSADLPTVGVVRPNTASNTLTWKALGLDAVEVRSQVLGKPGDLILSGGDFNGDGITDAAVARLVKNKWQWEVMTSPLSDGRPRTYKFTLGSAGDRLSFAKISKDGDWACAFGLDPKTKRSVLLARNIVTKKQIAYRRFPRGLSGGQRPRPIPVGQSDGTDLLVFVTSDETDTTLQVYTPNGTPLGKKLAVSGLGKILVGDLLVYPDDESAAPGEEIALKTSSGLRIFNPSSRAVQNRTDVSGELVDPITVVSTAGPTPVPSPTATPTATPTGKAS
jgi:hypothetical protein